MAHYYYVWKWPRKWLGRPMSPGGQCRGGQCHLEANVFFQREANVGEVNVGEANVIAPFLNGDLKTRKKCLLYGLKCPVLITWSDHLKTKKSIWKVKCLDFRCWVFKWLQVRISEPHCTGFGRFYSWQAIYDNAVFCKYWGFATLRLNWPWDHSSGHDEGHFSDESSFWMSCI